MHVPYSMDDSEPDLYGSLGSSVDEVNDLWWQERNVRMEYVECPKFYTQADIDKLINTHIQAMDQMRQEVLEAYEDGYEKAYDIGYNQGQADRPICDCEY